MKALFLFLALFSGAAFAWNNPGGGGGGITCGSDGTFVGRQSGVMGCYTPSGGGNVTGPGSSTAHHVASYADTSGTVLEDAGFAKADVGLLDAIQTWSAANTFTAAPVMSALTASEPVCTSAGKALASCTAASIAITSMTGDVTGTGPGATATTVAKIQGTVVSGTTGSGNVVFATSPTLTNPVVGTQSTADSSTKAASTAYVQANLASYLPLAGGTLSTNPVLWEDSSSALYPVQPGVNTPITCTTATTIDFSTETAGEVIPINLTASDTCVVTLTNQGAGGQIWILHIGNASSATVTLPASVDFGGQSYTPGAAGTFDNVTLTVIDSTPHINGSVSGTGYAH